MAEQRDLCSKLKKKTWNGQELNQSCLSGIDGIGQREERINKKATAMVQ